MSVDIEKLIQDDIKDRTNKILREKSLREYYNNPNYCKYCGKLIVVRKTESTNITKRKNFCDSSCSASYNNQGIRRNYNNEINYDSNNQCINCGVEVPRRNKYCSGKCMRDYQQKEWEEKWFKGEINGNISPVWTSISKRVRTYLFKKYNNKCSKCGWGEVNPYTGTIPLEVEHIDGNPYNTVPANVTLLCPNCHALTKTYRGANRGNGRGRTWLPKPINVDI